MHLHASCAARGGDGVLLLGAPGAGKSDLLLRLLDRGFRLVADDRVEVSGGVASAPAAGAGLLEVRGLGILRLPHTPDARLVLAVSLDPPPGGRERLPHPARHPAPDLPLLWLDPTLPSAAQRVELALDCALGRQPTLAGAFA